MSEFNEDPTERASRYIAALETQLSKLRPLSQDTVVKTSNIERTVDAINRYLQDAKFHLKDGKPVTSLASVAYAEGLLDALAFLKLGGFEVDG